MLKQYKDSSESIKMLSLTKGHISNKDGIYWLEGCPYERGSTVFMSGWSVMSSLSLSVRMTTQAVSRTASAASRAYRAVARSAGTACRVPHSRRDRRRKWQPSPGDAGWVGALENLNRYFLHEWTQDNANTILMGHIWFFKKKYEKIQCIGDL